MSNGYGVYGRDCAGDAGLEGVDLGALLRYLQELGVAGDVFFGELCADGGGDVVEVVGREGEDRGASA